MRFLSGIILGVLLTVAVAFVFDSTRKTDGPEGAVEQKMVNWDLVQKELKDLSSNIHDGWNRLTGHKEG
jgi:hypothetical protein